MATIQHGALGTRFFRHDLGCLNMRHVICHISTAHPADDVRIYHKECLSLASAGRSVHLVAGRPRKDIVGSAISLHIDRGNWSTRVPRLLFRGWKLLGEALRVDADIFHFHDPEFIPMALVLKLLGKHVIYDVHEDLPRDILNKIWIPRPFRRPLARASGLFENMSARCFDGIVSATPTIAERFSFKKDRAIVARNFPKQSEYSEELPKWESREEKVCYVGKITEDRGLEQIIRATAEAGVLLVLAGEVYPAGLESRIREASRDGRVEWRGYLERTKTIELMRSARVGLLLLHPHQTYREALPIKLFEYMAAGLPVIASDFPLWREIIEEAECGLCVDPFDVDAIAGGIEALLSTPSRSEQMGKNGRQAIMKHYTWEHEAQEITRLYDSILGRSRAHKMTARL